MRAPSAGATGVIIETERLRMRAHRDGDLPDLVVLAGNWEIARWTGTIPHPYSETDGREWIAAMSLRSGIGWVSLIGATDMLGKPRQLSSITGSGPSASKRSAHIPTQATQPRKRFFCAAAYKTWARSSC
jgi:hypothetical protein